MSDEPKSRRGKATKSKRGEAAQFKAGGAATPAVFDAQALSEKLNLWWRNSDGDSFWVNNSTGWGRWPLGAIEHLLTTQHVRKAKREGEFIGDQSRLLLHVREHRKVDEVLAALSGYPANIYETISGQRIVVRSSPRKVEPVEGEWETICSMLEAKLNLSSKGGADQLPYFHGWMKTALEALYLGGPGNFRPGQCCIFAGPRDSAKSRIQHQIITGLLGGRSADPGPYLFGRTDFNGELFGAEHLMMEDPASSTLSKDRVFFGEQLKGLIVNDTQRLHRKREDAIVLAPFWRSTISINDDPDKMRVLPLLTPDIKDKLMLFLVSSDPLPMPTTTLGEREEFRRVISAELPAYAWWLLNSFSIPDGSKEGEQDLRSQRFGVKEWHHPTLAMELFDDTPAAELLQIIDAAEFTSPAVSIRKLWALESEAAEDKRFHEWEGTAIDLERLLLGEGGYECTVAREAKKLAMHNKIDRLLGRLKEDQPHRVAPHRVKWERRWIISKPS